MDEGLYLMTKQDRKPKGGRRGREMKDKFAEERRNRVPPLTAKSENQKKALRAFNTKPLVVLSGSSGSGKTMLMCWYASKLWLEGKIDNIVITRPYQHLGADYGAIKGDDFQKLLPFVMSMLTKFKDFLGVGILRNNLRTTVEDGLFNEVSGIEVVPVEKIQGRSFNNRTIILADEFQNVTPAQMKSVVTRMEEGCQLFIAGDPIQTALRGKNGLSMLEDILAKNKHEDAEVIKFTPEDNCRSGISGFLANLFEKEGEWQ